MSQAASESPLLNRKKAPCSVKKVPCYGRKSSLLWERKFRVISPLMEGGERPWLAEQGPPRRPLSAFRGCSPGVSILVFSKAWGYSSANRRFFLFQKPEFVLKCQRAALATFELTPFSPATKIFALVGLHREFNIMSVLSMRRLAARGPQPRAAREGGSIQLQCALDAHGEIARSAVAWSHDGIRESRGLRRAASKSLHLDRRRLQHELGHSRLSRRRRSMEAARAGDLSGLHGRRGDAPALLGAQPYRMATHSPRPAERCASRLGPARGHGQGARSF